MQLDVSALQAGLADIRRSPAQVGTVALVVRRPAVDERETLDEAWLDIENGLVGRRLEAPQQATASARSR